MTSTPRTSMISTCPLDTILRPSCDCDMTVLHINVDVVCGFPPLVHVWKSPRHSWIRCIIAAGMNTCAVQGTGSCVSGPVIACTHTHTHCYSDGQLERGRIRPRCWRKANERCGPTLPSPEKWWWFKVSAFIFTGSAFLWICPKV